MTKEKPRADWPSEIIEAITWDGIRSLSNGRDFATDGKILLDTDYWNPYFPDDVLPDRECRVPAVAFERILRMKAGNIVVALDELDFDRKQDCFAVPGHNGIKLGKSYIYFLIALRPSSQFRLRCTDSLSPVFIYHGRLRFGALMPLRERQTRPKVRNPQLKREAQR